MKKYLAVQTGARRGYAVPAKLAERAMLARFYTDIAGNTGIGALSKWLIKLPIKKAALEKLANREIPAEVLPATQTFAWPWIKSAIIERFSSASPRAIFARHLVTADHWGRSLAKAGFGHATHLYAMLSEPAYFMRAARQAGLTVIAEVYILISTEEIMEEERRLFPGWEPNQPNWPQMRAELDVNQYLFNDVDYYICPSEAVKNDLIDRHGIEQERCFLVPYGMNPKWLDLTLTPEPGRVLFVGSAELRKGIHYLAQAANLLVDRGKSYEFRVAGNVTETIKRQAACKNLRFLGRVSRDKIHEEFQKADVFVLPSLAEGSAEVTYEALGAALPQVVTPSAGSVARDGIEGLVVPERDPIALAEAIEKVVEDRELRDSMSKAARERAKDYVWDRYGDRLIKVLSSL